MRGMVAGGTKDLAHVDVMNEVTDLEFGVILEKRLNWNSATED